MKEPEQFNWSQLGKPFTEEDLEYLCRFWDYDGQVLVAYALDRPPDNLCKKVYKLKKSGKFDYYKNLNKHWCI